MYDQRMYYVVGKEVDGQDSFHNAPRLWTLGLASPLCLLSKVRSQDAAYGEKANASSKNQWVIT